MELFTYNVSLVWLIFCLFFSFLRSINILLSHNPIRVHAMLLFVFSIFYFGSNLSNALETPKISSRTNGLGEWCSHHSSLIKVDCISIAPLSLITCIAEFPVLVLCKDFNPCFFPLTKKGLKIVIFNFSKCFPNISKVYFESVQKTWHPCAHVNFMVNSKHTHTHTLFLFLSPSLSLSECVCLSVCLCLSLCVSVCVCVCLSS